MTPADATPDTAATMPPACVLAGGLGLRLRPAVADRPKPLAEVAGRPFLCRVLDQLAAAGVGRVVLCTGYGSSMVEERLGRRYAGMELAHSVESEPLGTAGALRLALARVDAPRVLALNGDSYCEVDLAAFAADHHTSGARASMVVAELPDTRHCGRVAVDGEGWIRSYEEKGATAGRGLVNAGVYLLERAVLEAIPPGRAVSIERETFPSLVGAGLRAFRTTGRLLDIGTPESLAGAAAFFDEEGA